LDTAPIKARFVEGGIRSTQLYAALVEQAEIEELPWAGSLGDFLQSHQQGKFLLMVRSVVTTAPYSGEPVHAIAVADGQAWNTGGSLSLSVLKVYRVVRLRREERA
jgi:hypothetical protein